MATALFSLSQQIKFVFQEIIAMLKARVTSRITSGGAGELDKAGGLRSGFSDSPFDSLPDSGLLREANVPIVSQFMRSGLNSAERGSVRMAHYA